MLKTLELSNFRKVEHDVMVFTNGLNTIKGANEAGKSTRLEAVAYALFGSRALRSTLDDAVTYGKAPNSMRVALTLTHEGRNYTFTRSKAGAEVIEDGKVYVTGQTECSNFAAKILGADVSVANKLMFANQGNLRGSLEAGPKATAELIEDLADFELFTRIIEAAQDKLMMGSPAVLESTLVNAQANLDAFATPAMVPESEIRLKIKTLDDEIAKVEGTLPGLKADSDTLTDAWLKLKATHEAGVAVQTRLLEMAASIEKLKGRHNEAVKASEQPVDLDRLAVLERQRAEVDEEAQRRIAYQAFLKLPIADHIWEGDGDSLDKAGSQLREEVKRITAQIADADKRAAVLESTLVTSSACGFCGQDVSQFPGVAEANTKIKGEIETLGSLKVALASERKSKEAELKVVEDIVRLNNETLKAVGPLSKYLTADHSTVPPMFSWAGAVPCDNGVNVKGIEGEIETLKYQIVARDKAMILASVLSDELSQHQGKLDALKAQPLHVLSDDEYLAEQSKADRASSQYYSAQGQVNTLKLERDDQAEDLTAQLERQAMALQQHATLVDTVAKAKANLAELHFNNALIKKIRAARPLIGDKLWSMVLASVSTMFTAMRGERSIVSKDKDGFKVNGQDVVTLSGSTLDILGLAIRLSLVRTFLPTCGFLVLDEPFAGADAGRTSLSLGFLKSCGFNQILLVTHEDISEIVSDGVIEL